MATNRADAARGAVDALQSIARWQRVSGVAAVAAVVMLATLMAGVVFLWVDYMRLRAAAVHAIEVMGSDHTPLVPGASLRRAQR